MLLTLAVASAALGCQQPDEPFELPDDLVDIDIAGELVDVTIDDGVVVCAGDIAAMDAHARAVYTLLGLPEDGERIHAAWTSMERVAELCPGMGCARGRLGIASSLQVMQHEIGHAIASEFGSPPALWGEGLAVALEPRGLPLVDDHPAEMLPLPPDELDYDQAGNFVRWLWREHSAERVIEVFRRSKWFDDERSGARTFEDVFGTSLVAAGDRYFAEAPASTPPLVPLPEPLPWTDGVWRQSFRLECDAPEARAGLGGLRAVAYVEIDVAGAYELAASSGRVAIEAIDGWPITYTKPPISTFPQEVMLDVGVYAIEVTGAGMVAAELRPDLDGVPTVPD